MLLTSMCRVLCAGESQRRRCVSRMPRSVSSPSRDVALSGRSRSKSKSRSKSHVHMHVMCACTHTHTHSLSLTHSHTLSLPQLSRRHCHISYRPDLSPKWPFVIADCNSKNGTQLNGDTIEPVRLRPPCTQPAVVSLCVCVCVCACVCLCVCVCVSVRL